MHKIQFRLCSAPDPTGELSRPLAGLGEANVYTYIEVYIHVYMTNKWTLLMDVWPNETETLATRNRVAVVMRNATTSLYKPEHIRTVKHNTDQKNELGEGGRKKRKIRKIRKRTTLTTTTTTTTRKSRTEHKQGLLQGSSSPLRLCGAFECSMRSKSASPFNCQCL